MTQREYLSAGTDVVFPYTSIQAISSDGESIGEGDRNETLQSLLTRVFTRIKNLEKQVTTLASDVDDLTNKVRTLTARLGALQFPTPTEHFTLYLYTFTESADTQPEEKLTDLFTNEGYLLDKRTLNSNKWFFTIKEATKGAKDNNVTSPGIWELKVEVFKKENDEAYFVYPSMSDFIYNPCLSVLSELANTKSEINNKVQVVQDLAESFPTTLAELDANYTDTISAVVNNAFDNKQLTSTNINKWNTISSLEAVVSNGLTAESILNKLANNTENITFGDNNTRTAKQRLSEILFGDNVLNATDYMQTTGLTELKKAVAGLDVEQYNKPFKDIVQEMATSTQGVIVNTGEGFSEATFTAWADTDEGKQILRKAAGCKTSTDNDGNTTYQSVQDSMPTVGQIRYAVNTWTSPSTQACGGGPKVNTIDHSEVCSNNSSLGEG